jgi:hypothetical protein
MLRDGAEMGNSLSVFIRSAELELSVATFAEGAAEGVSEVSKDMMPLEDAGR